MNPSASTPEDARRRAKAATLIATMRELLGQLEHYLGAVDGLQLSGDLWLSTLETAELATRRAFHTTTHDGVARLGG
jgi:hypothetical protein